MVSSDTAFRSVSLYSNICSKAAVSAHYSHWILDCILVGIIYSWLRWIIYTPGKYFYFFAELFQALTIGKDIYIPLGDFRPGACSSRCFPRACSWEPCYMDWTWICQSSPWSWLEICCQQHSFSYGLHHCCSLWNSGNFALQLHDEKKKKPKNWEQHILELFLLQPC